MHDLAEILGDAEPLLSRLARRLCANPADASDLVQDTFERAARVGLAPDVRNPRAWLTTIMVHLFIDRRRMHARRPPRATLDPAELGAPAPEAAPAWSQLEVSDVRAALDTLDARYREVFELHAFEGWSYARLAERFGVQPITIGTRLTRARHQLRQVLTRRLA